MTESAMHIEPSAYTILLVDDKPTNLTVAANYLDGLGFHVLTARDGHVGLNRAQTNNVDLILLDVLMPGMNGFETCRQLKADPRTKEIPVIFMTSLDETMHKVNGFEAGGVDYVTKPFQQEELLARIDTHLRIRNLTHNLKQMVMKRTQELTDSLARERILVSKLEHSLQQSVALNAFKSQIIEVVSHEFRTPLAIISQGLHLLENHSDQLSTEQKEKQYMISNESIAAMNKMVRDITFIYETNEEEPEITRTPTKVSALYEVIVAMIDEVFEHKREQITLVYHDEEATMVTDVARVRQIVQELIANSLKFSPHLPQVTVTVTLSRSLVHISVKDKGIGIPMSEQTHIFELFGRASNVDARRGLGLGLFIAKRLATSLGGYLDVHSDGREQGALFALMLPIE